MSSIGFVWTHAGGVTETKLHGVQQKKSKAASRALKEGAKSNKTITQEKPPEKAKPTVKKSTPRSPPTTRILPSREVKADVVGSGTLEKNANPSIVAAISAKDAQKQDVAQEPSKAAAKKTNSSGLSNAEKRNRCCSVDGCTKFRQNKCDGMCKAHYSESKLDNDNDGDTVSDHDLDIEMDESWRKVEPCDLTPNARVLIVYKDEKLYRATVRECPNKKGGKYRIHYDGWNKAKSELVPFSRFCALLDEDNRPVEMAETSDDGDELVYSVQVFVYSDGKTAISSIEANATTSPTATEAVADLAINLEWRQSLESLVSHQKQYGCIPPERTKAYKWFVKQTYEYSRKKIGRRSSLSLNQIALLEQKAGFVFRDGSGTATKRQHDEMSNDVDSKSLPKQSMKRVKKN